VTCLPMMVPRGVGSSIVMIALMCTSQKNQAPDFSETRSYTARGTSAGAIKFYIVMMIDAVEQSLAASQRELGSGAKSSRGMIWTLLP
jgi:hypothetical protein